MFVHVALNQNNAIYESLFYHGNKSQSFHGSLQYSALSCFSGFEMVKLMGGGGGTGRYNSFRVYFTNSSVLCSA